MADTVFLKALTEVPSVGTACKPVLNLLTERFGDGYQKTFVPDGFCLFQKQGGVPSDLRVVFIAHVDEVGGCVYGPHGGAVFRGAGHGELGADGYFARIWGNTPDIFDNARLQAFDWLAEDGAEAYPVELHIAVVDGEERLIVSGDKVRPYRTAFTFTQETTFSGDTIAGKALDPRVTAYAVAQAVLELGDPRVAALFVMAEECAMDVARKAVTFLDRNAPNVALIVNADVPGVQNLSEGRLDLPAIRIFEGRNFIDPSFGIATSDELHRRGVEFHLSAARSGSQTLLFTPLAPTLSIALPAEDIHLPLARMSLTGTDRCVSLLKTMGETALQKP